MAPESPGDKIRLGSEHSEDRSARLVGRSRIQNVGFVGPAGDDAPPEEVAQTAEQHRVRLQVRERRAQ